MMRYQWLRLSIGLGLLLLLGVFALLVSRRAALVVIVPPAAPVVSSTVDMMASEDVSTSHVISAAQAITQSGWLTFTDAEAGYSIQYPANFYINAGTSKSKGEIYRTTSILFRSPAIPRYQEMVIQVEPNPDNLSIDAVIKRIYERVSTRVLDTRSADRLAQMTVAGMTAYQTTVLPGNADIHILLPYNKKVYYFALGHDLGAVESTPQAKVIFFQILNTFQLKNGE